MSYDRLASRLYNAPLLISPQKAEIIERVFRAYVDGTAASLPKYEPEVRESITLQATQFRRTAAGYQRSDDGVALIQVIGSLVQRHAPDAMSRFESYENIGGQVKAAMDDPKVKGILLELDSPGGEGGGIAALGDLIRAVNEQKPVVAHANEMAFSAAYWLGVAAGELYVPKTGLVGSVGVIMLHVDQSRLNEKRGIDVTHIYAGARKADFSPYQPLSDTALGNAQAMCDRLYGQFVDHVAAARGIDPDMVRATEAALLNPDEAIAAGMADGVATLEESLQRLDALMRDSKKRKGYGRAAANAQLPGQENADMDTKPAAALAQPAVITQEQLAAAKAEGVSEGRAAVTADADKAREAERARIKAITTHAEAEGRTALAQHLAHNTTMSVEESVAMLTVAEKCKPQAAAPANLLAAEMAKLGNPKIGADAGEGEETEAAVGARIAAAANSLRPLKLVKK